VLNIPNLLTLAVIFGFMWTAVSLLPSVVRLFQERYRLRVTGLSRELDKFFVHIQASHLIGGALGLGAVLGILTQSWVLGGSAAIAAVFVPRIVLAIWKSVRSAQFEAQFMDALGLISNALKSGLDIATGVELVATNMTPPVSEEFGLVLNAYRLGAPLEGALVDMTRRIRSRVLETAVSAINIQRETGGNLVKTFDQMIQTVREETKLQKKVRALSAQGKLQVAVLAVLPWGLAVFLYFISPDMFTPVLQSPAGQAILIALIVWEIIGILITKRIVTVDV